MTTEETRRESYADTNKTVVTVSKEIYHEVFLHGPVSAWALAGHLKRAVYTVRPRLTELKGMGKIREAGKVWCEHTQRNETLWDVVDKQARLF